MLILRIMYILPPVTDITAMHHALHPITLASNYSLKHRRRCLTLSLSGSLTAPLNSKMPNSYSIYLEGNLFISHVIILIRCLVMGWFDVWTPPDLHETHQYGVKGTERMWLLNEPHSNVCFRAVEITVFIHDLA